MLNTLKRWVLIACVGVQAVSGFVDTFFLSDVHIGDPQNTWSAVDAAFGNFRKDHPNATHFVYAGDSIKHASPSEDQKADEYLSKLISLAISHGFRAEDIWVAQGNNDGPHDKPLSPKWASAAVASGVVPDSDKETALKGSYYSKCSGRVCGIVINTDLEVYGTGDSEAEDKAVYNASLTKQEYAAILSQKHDQHLWVQTIINHWTASGKIFFVLGHHPQLTSFFPSGNINFQGGVCGHTHAFAPTDAQLLTVLPGYTSEAVTQGYVASSLGVGKLSMDWGDLTHYDFEKRCFYPNGGKCGSGAAAVMV